MNSSLNNSMDTVEKTGGIAFELILKEANNKENSPALLRNISSPMRSAFLSNELIEKKLLEAQERRHSLEVSKQRNWLKEKNKITEASLRVQEVNDSFSKETEKKLQKRMDAQKEKKDAHMKALMDRLTQHAQKVDEIRKMSDQYSLELKERIERKMETTGGKREAQLAAIQERLREHKKHVDEVIESNATFSKQTKEKMISKMENSLKNREKQLNQLMDRIRNHNTRAEQVCKSRSNQSVMGVTTLDDSISACNLSTLNMND
ncbi:hypothetical protein HELRODRAFT_186233 [Helobdella robusta]|uniref:Stathmin n=1 Tax=Helobdella robusta TaxID=6412 RepID=T1FNU7_HELRO|nr:hypothetical protein HELRODRAFT_186233 [Helobdella robusta]ESN89889.1 hypothetical protein HELRODRAFT_186233 [Helobdella robusta]